MRLRIGDFEWNGCWDGGGLAQDRAGDRASYAAASRNGQLSRVMQSTDQSVSQSFTQLVSQSVDPWRLHWIGSGKVRGTPPFSARMPSHAPATAPFEAGIGVEFQRVGGHAPRFVASYSQKRKQRKAKVLPGKGRCSEATVWVALSTFCFGVEALIGHMCECVPPGYHLRRTHSGNSN